MGTDIDACYDGECEILVTEPVDIPIDPDLEVVDTLSVTAVEDDLVTILAVFPNDGGAGYMTLGQGGRSSVGNTNVGTEIHVEAIAISEEGAVLTISFES